MAPSSLLNKIDVFSLNLQQASYKTISAQAGPFVVATLVPFILTGKLICFGDFCILPCVFDVFSLSLHFFCFFCYKTAVLYCSNHTSGVCGLSQTQDFTNTSKTLKRQACFCKGAITVQFICVLLFRLHKCHFHTVFLIVLTLLILDGFVMSF